MLLPIGQGGRSWNIGTTIYKITDNIYDGYEAQDAYNFLTTVVNTFVYGTKTNTVPVQYIVMLLLLS
jgi:hypothetical protein